MTTKIIGANITDGSVTSADLNAAAKSSGATDGNAFNIGVLGFKIAVNEGLTIFNLVDGIVDEFNSESGIDTAENVTSPYDSSSDFYSNLDGPNPIPSPQASLTQITSSGLVHLQMNQLQLLLKFLHSVVEVQVVVEVMVLVAEAAVVLVVSFLMLMFQ